jgi:hypothetical protein
MPIAALTAAALLLAPAGAAAKAKTQPVGWGPLTSKQAAKKVKRSDWEPRPDNNRPNRRVPKRGQLRAWQARSEMPYARFVNGRFKGTTDEIIQWAAYKWGINTNVIRAVAALESWWHMSAVDDNGDSFGLFQVRRPFHCWGECLIARRSTAFNADYYGGIIRAYFDGKMKWLNTVERGRDYVPGDLWGSVGAWFSGRWWTQPSADYVARVKGYLKDRVWKRRYFDDG